MPPKPKVIAVATLPAATLRDDAAVARLFAIAVFNARLDAELNEVVQEPDRRFLGGCNDSRENTVPGT